MEVRRPEGVTSPGRPREQGPLEKPVCMGVSPCPAWLQAALVSLRATLCRSDDVYLCPGPPPMQGRFVVTQHRCCSELTSSPVPLDRLDLPGFASTTSRTANIELPAPSYGRRGDVGESRTLRPFSATVAANRNGARRASLRLAQR